MNVCSWQTHADKEFNTWTITAHVHSICILPHPAAKGD